MSYYKTIISLAVPIIIGQIGTIITGVADTVMVGQHSTEELAASAFVNNVFNLFMIIGIGFTFNFAPLVGNSLAKNDKKDVGNWLKNSLAINSVLGIVLAAMLATIYINVEKMGQPTELLPLIKPYFVVYGLSIIPVMLYTTFRQFVEAILRPATSMWIFLIGNILNVIGNYILIYGKLGMPELGLYGAGISTLISRCFMVIAFLVVFKLTSHYSEYFEGYRQAKVTKQRQKSLFNVGMPIGMQQGFEAATFSIAAVMVGWLGSFELAAHQVAVSLSSICYMLYLGLGNAVAIRVSYFKGMNDLLAVRNITNAGIILSFVLSLIISTVLYFGVNQISMLFTDDVEVAKIVASVIPILMIYLFSDGAQIVLANALRGLADVKIIMYISALAYFVIAVPAGYFFGFVMDMKIVGIWLAYPIGFFFACITFYMRFYKSIKPSPKS